MANKLEQFLEKQINSGNIEWESKSKLIRSSNEQVNGHTTKILKKFENKFNFSIDLKNKEIKKYFDKLPKNSIINVLRARDEINKNLSSKNQIGGERSCKIIYDRLKDPKFNNNNLKPQTLDNQVSRVQVYKVSKQFEDKVKNMNDKLKDWAYIYLEDTQAGNKTLRLHIFDSILSKDKRKNEKKYIVGKTIKSTTFPPNDESLKKIQKLINER
jgi:hypothetical protein|tara:strand:- start:580 stop:1221 length:642 start_codon:yes stop_codon:yes gene_type:complete